MLSKNLVICIVAIALFGVVNADRDDEGHIFSRAAVQQALGVYGTQVNQLLKLSKDHCTETSKPGLAAGIATMVSTSYSSQHTKYFRTGGQTPLDFSIGGTNFLTGARINNTAELLAALNQFYNLIYNGFTSYTHWLYSGGMTIDFTARNADFDNLPTALVVVENQFNGFGCNGNQPATFTIYFNTFHHVFCYTPEEGWRICGFFEDNKAIFEQSSSLFTQDFP